MEKQEKPLERKTEIVLLGNRYSIKSHLSDSQLHNLVHKVETLIQTCQAKSKSMSMSSAAVMACILIANEQMELQEKIDTFKNDTVLQLAKLKELLDEQNSIEQKRSPLTVQEKSLEI